MNLAFVVGLAAAIWVVLAFYITGETRCEERHDVYDCSWQRTPFLPVTPTAQEPTP